MLSPDLTIIGDLDTPLVGHPGTTHRPGDEIARVYTVVCRFPVKAEGNYSIEIYSDTRWQKAFFFVVRKEETTSS